MTKIKRFNGACWIATFVVVVVGTVGNFIFYRQIASEDENALIRLAEINAKASAPSQRFSSVDEKGVTHHTLCTGGGWCVTDRVPPEDFANTSTKKKPGTIPVVDVKAITQIIEARDSKGIAKEQ